MTQPADSFPRLSAMRLIAFSIAGLAIGGVQTAVGLFLPIYYAGRFGIINRHQGQFLTNIVRR